MVISAQTRVLVTGAASGLGLALVRGLVERGCQVLATDLHDEASAALGGLIGVDYLPLDVCSDEAWATAHAWVVEHWGGLDLLVNNAGVAAGARLELTDMAQWQRILDVNLLGVVRGCRTFTPMLKRQGSGHLVNVASAAGLVHPPRMSEYNTVKAGVVALSETLLHELRPFGVRVSVVCPAFFRTGLASSLQGRDADMEAAAARMINGSKVTADDVAARVITGIERGRYLIIPGIAGRGAYWTKRLARPVHDWVMARVSARMVARDGAVG